MLKRIPIFCLIFSLLFTIPVFANPEIEGTTDIEDAAEVEVISEEEANLTKFKNDFNTKGVIPENLKQIYVIRAPKYVPVVTLPDESVDSTETTEGSESAPVASTAPVEEILYFGMFDSQVFFSVEDPEFELWLDEMCDDIARDAIIGLEEIFVSKITIDHIKLETWGDFLYKYYQEKVSDIKSGDIIIEYGDYIFNIKNSPEAKELLLDYIVPALIDRIKTESGKYPVREYSLDIPNGSLLSEYELDLSHVREMRTVYPLDGISKYSFGNVGDIYVLNLSKSYVDILRCYIEDGKTGYNKRVEGSVPGSVNILANVVLLRDIRNNTLNDKVLTDFTTYKNLAVRLDTKALVDVDNVTTVKELYYGDYSLNMENLLLLPIQDTTVVIQPTYLECFSYAGLERNFGRKIDATDFVTMGSPYMTYSYQVQGENGPVVQKIEIPIEYFANDGILDTRLGNAPFLIYYASHTPYDKLVDWGYNSGNLNEEQQEQFISTIKNDMKNQGREDEFDSYVKAAGQMTDGTKTLIIGGVAGVVLIFAIVVFVIIRKKLKEANNNPMNNRSVLFDDNDFDMNDDDDDDAFGGFELK